MKMSDDAKGILIAALISLVVIAAEAVHVWWMWDLLYPTTTNERREFNRQNNIPNQEVIE